MNNALNISELKVNNRFRILDCLRHSPLSRAELSVKTGLAKSSVTTITNELINQGILSEAGLAKKSKKAGRTRVLLDINADFGFALGINLHRKKITVAATDIKGKVLFEFFGNTCDFETPYSVLEFIKTGLGVKLAEHGISAEKLVGIGVSSPGPLDFEKGVILLPPNFSLFNNFPIVEELKKEYSCPVFLENNAVSLALYEHYYFERQASSTLFVTIADGIGSAFLKDGEIYRGAHGIAGEIGHISIDPEGEECPCGNRGCLELYATLSSLKKRFGFDSYENIIDSAAKGDNSAKKIIDFLTNTLGRAFVGAVNLFDLDKIIIYGEYFYKGEIIAEKIEEYIKNHSVICKAHPVNVTVSKQNFTTAAAAAATPALNNFFKENMI